MSNAYPRWVQREPAGAYNLREVGPNLYVGAFASAAVEVPFSWTAIFDFCGSSEQYLDDYPIPPVNLEFDDGCAIKVSTLDLVYAEITQKKGPVLLHCAQGLSRSASVAYAMLRRSDLDHATALQRVQVDGFRQYPMTDTLESARAWSEAFLRSSR